MRSSFSLVLLAAVLALGLRAASAQGGAEAAADVAGDAVYVITYFDALPSAAAQARELLATGAAEGRRTDGNLQFEALQEAGRPYRFAVLEKWRDAEAQAAHSHSVSAERIRSRLTPLLYSPPDERNHGALLVAPPRNAEPDDATAGIYVLTHVDIVPPRLQQSVEYLRVLAEASRGEAGNLGFDVLVTDRRNHMTIVEAWRSAGAQEAHLAAPPVASFRSNIAPLLGALYDDRLYRPLR